MTESAQLGAALPQGTLLGHCEIREVLGRGGGGISYLAYDAHLEREVVIKEHFPPTLCFRVPGEAAVQPVSADGYERSLAAFCREARILAGVSYPGVVRVYDIFQACGTAYMLMEYVEGERLAEWLPAHAAERTAVTAVLLHLLAALDWLHASEVLHRDIKPSNIIIRPDGQPVLIDFGAAMLGTPPTTITLVGTPGYAAPEQFQQHGRVGPWSDLYALAHSFAKLLPVKELRRYPRRFVRALRRAGEDEIERRFASASTWTDVLQKSGSHTSGILLALVSFLLGVASIVGWAVLSDSEESRRMPESSPIESMAAPAPESVPSAASSDTMAEKRKKIMVEIGRNAQQIELLANEMGNMSAAELKQAFRQQKELQNKRSELFQKLQELSQPVSE